MNPRYLMGLAAPFALATISFVLVASERGWIPACLVAAFLFIPSVLVWDRQIRKYPDDPWKFRF